MAVLVDNLRVAKRWSEQLDGDWIIIRAGGVSRSSMELTVEDLERIAEQSDWVDLDDASDLPLAQDGYMFGSGLIFGNGSELNAETIKSSVCVNAYRRSQYKERQRQYEERKQVVKNWLNATSGYRLLRAVGTGSRDVQPDEILRILDRFDTRWVTISTANAQTPGLHPMSLLIAWDIPDGRCGHHLFVAIAMD